MPDQPSGNPPAVFTAPSPGKPPAVVTAPSPSNRCARCSALLNGASICPHCQAYNVIDPTAIVGSAPAAGLAASPGPRRQPSRWIGVTLIGAGAFILLVQVLILVVTASARIGADAITMLFRILLIVTALAMIVQGVHLNARWGR